MKEPKYEPLKMSNPDYAKKYWKKIRKFENWQIEKRRLEIEPPKE